MAHMTAEQFFFLSGAELKAQKVVYRRHRVNRGELSALLAVVSFLTLYGRQVVSGRVLIEWLGITGQVKRNFHGYLWGCVKHGMLHRLRYVAGKQTGPGYSLGLTPYGAKVLGDFWRELEKLEKGRPVGGGIEGLLIDPNRPPKRYTLVERGRME